MQQQEIRLLNLGGKVTDASVPIIMGILNVTPDSFYASSRVQSSEQVLQRAAQILHEGGTIIDVGAYSTRPGAEPVSEEEELRRLEMSVPLIKEHFPQAIVSVDTFRAAVAKRCVQQWHADVINDVSEGGKTGIVDTPINEKLSMFETVAELNVPYILMSVQRTITEMMQHFASEVNQLDSLGVKDIILDPGFGFGKPTAEDNLDVLRHMDMLGAFHLPVLVGLSRKSLFRKMFNLTPEESLHATIAAHTIALQKGARILRVHDVKPAFEAAEIFRQTL